MAKSLNFNNIKKQYLTVTLPDARKTVLQVGTPTKAIMTELMSLEQSFSKISETLGEGESIESESLSELYKACALLLSRNKGGITVTQEYLESIFDMEDIVLLFKAYMDFVMEVSNAKN